MTTVRVLCMNALVLLFALATGAAPQQHPAYLHALSDLRDARAHLQRPNGGALEHQEQDAIAEIDKAIGEIKAASIDDGKNIDDHAPVDEHLQWGGRLHRALQLLDKAQGDISKEEDNGGAQGLKHRAIDHIARARAHVKEAIAITH
jgi:hypothetical protein